MNTDSDISIFKYILSSSEGYLETSWTSTIKLFYENISRLKSFNYFFEKAPSYLFDWVQNTPRQFVQKWIETTIFNRYDKFLYWNNSTSSVLWYDNTLEQCFDLCSDFIIIWLYSYFLLYNEKFCIHFWKSVTVYQKPGLLFKAIKISMSYNSVEFIVFLWNFEHVFF